MLDAQDERLSADGLADGIAMGGKLIANRRSDQVRPVGIEPLLNEKIDLSEVDIAKVDRDLLVGRFGG
ncbi:hypothetical protein D3C81_1790760 [compost metagenome]